jgi:hypothetical protein
MFPIVPIAIALIVFLRWVNRKGEEGQIRRTVPAEQLPAALAEMHEHHAEEDRKRSREGCFTMVLAIAFLALLFMSFYYHWWPGP